MAKHKHRINAGSLIDPTGPHAVVGKALRDARLAKNMTAETLIEFLGDGTLTRTLISSYETGRYLPSLDRLARMMGALGAPLTDDIRKHYEEVIGNGSHMGQVSPGSRSRVNTAKAIIKAWQTAATVQEAADALGMEKRVFWSKVNHLRKCGVPLKFMRLSKSDYELLANFAESFLEEEEPQ